ncbi:cytochrome P450 [Streptomyces sp. NPDC005925]|uniref:cytochrome P450 n=1 Tax=Streptomyces sp. NPDC005925 TaxID=3157172 RepID=UPI0033E2A618
METVVGSVTEPVVESDPPGGQTPSVYRVQFPPGFTDRGGCPFDPPAALTDYSERAAIQPIDLTGGDTGWLVTGYDECRKLLADSRLSTDRLRNPRVAKLPPELREKLMDEKTRAGDFLAMDAPEHTRYRKVLNRQFTLRRIRELEPRILDIVTERIDAMLAKGATADGGSADGNSADLVRDFALPVPSLVICELLGVAPEDREEFQARTGTLLDPDVTFEEQLAGLDALKQFIHGLVRKKRAAPADDVLSGLVHADAEPALTDDEIVGMANLLLVGGHETTASMLALGTFALLEHPEQLRRLRERPELIDGAVEEMLRYLSIVPLGLLRTTIEEVEIAGQVVPAGALVILSVSAANRDPRRYHGPADFDVTRPRQAHLSFGHGIHQCIGQQLSRAEMTVGFAELLRRLPGLRLAIPADEVPLREQMAVYGVHSLPVAWDAPT